MRYDDSNYELLIKPVPTIDGLPEAMPRVSPYGSRMASGFGLVPLLDFPSKLVKPDEIEGVIKECHEKKIFAMYHQEATWAPEGFEWNQNGLPWCTTEDTEVLTNRGWVKWPDCVGSDLLGTINQVTRQLEFQAPLMRQVFEYDGEMMYSTNRRADFAVTPNHRMYVRKWDESKRTLSSDYSFVTADNLGWYSGLMHAPSGFQGTDIVEVEIPGDRRYDGDDFVSLLSIIVSDGYAGGISNPKTRNLVSFCCFNPKDYGRVKALAERVGFTEQKSRSGVWHRWDAGALANWVRANCYSGELGAQNKRVPDIVKCLSERQIKLFLTTYGDQCRDNPMTMYYSTSPKCVDDLQELLLRVGKRSTPSWSEPTTATMRDGEVIAGKYRCCTLCVSDTDRLCIDKKKHIEQDHYKGLVYCATVPNGTLVTRRNGSVLISGNCWTWGITAAVQDVEASEGKTTVPLAPNTNGWLVDWQQRGYFLDATIAGVKERGIAPASFVPSVLETNPRKFKEGWQEAALDHCVKEWWDTKRETDIGMICQALTILRTGKSCYIAYNWWGHALSCCGMNWNPGAYLNVDWVNRNSHKEKRPIVMGGRKAIPDELYGVRATKN